jgi:hypothetical protein
MLSIGGTHGQHKTQVLLALGRVLVLRIEAKGGVDDPESLFL